MSVDVVLFDVGSTLIDPDPGIAEIFCSVSSEFGYSFSLDDVSPHMKAVDAYYESAYCKDGDFWCSPQGSKEIWYDMYRFLCHLCDIPEQAEAISDRMYQRYLEPSAWAVFDDVRSALTALVKDHYRLGVVSNWDTSLISLLRGLQLAVFFEDIVSSADVGYRKPDPVIFDLACERLGTTPQRCVHIGDRADADGVGATRAGITPILIDRSQSISSSDYRVVNSLIELPKVISEL